MKKKKIKKIYRSEQDQLGENQEKGYWFLYGNKVEKFMEEVKSAHLVFEVLEPTF